MMSDYEILVLRELKKGNSDPERISRKTGLPELVVRAAIERVEGEGYSEHYGSKRRSIVTRDTLRLLVEVLIVYVAILLAMQVVPWLL
ncbi:hypothetical protein GAH_00513 [Geoglobus ahangari]|uniref:Uncharacterized protein n=1 Tax=Geoglobus ahangari TaxID=113653 RepID=A0A0F7IG25_9EURY|nr:hypothetical protein [Geoglobus ahangari]AKG92140.1 hypothetical protein GAH_00513 [Geoglobus ahangari]